MIIVEDARALRRGLLGVEYLASHHALPQARGSHHRSMQKGGLLLQAPIALHLLIPHVQGRAAALAAALFVGQQAVHIV